MKRDVPREVAATGLLAVDRRDAYLNLLLPRLLRERDLTGRDAAFATEIGYGAARRAGVLLEVVASAGGRDPATLDPEVRAVLLLGAYQLLHTRVPPHAAISTSVDLVRVLAGPRPAGLVNAVLRRVASADWPGWVDRLAPGDPIGRLAFAAGYPLWIAQAFADALGSTAAQAGGLAPALSDDAPAVHLVARPGRMTRESLLAEAGPRASAGRWSPYAVVLGGGDPGALASVRDGDAAVQDEGSQLVALALARAELVGTQDGRWLDMCAGPGGKAALLDGLLQSGATPGGRLVASELAPHRARLVAGALPPGRTVIADGRAPAWPDASFDRVLLDAPCSGLGALRRRPEARWRRRPADIDRLTELQRDLLRSALHAVRPGGVVAYATCSPHLAETRGVVDVGLAEFGGADRIDAWAVLPDLPRSTGPAHDPRDVQLWPHVHGTDAMYLALLRRSPAP